MVRKTAVAINLVQLALVGAFGVSQGLEMGLGQLLGLLVLAFAAVINLLALLFYQPWPADAATRPTRSTGPAKRSGVRVRYVLAPGPLFKTRKGDFRLLDLSEKGMRVRLEDGKPPAGRIKGQLELVCGRQVQVRCRVLRRQADEVALAFVRPLAYPLILTEKAAVEDR